MLCAPALAPPAAPRGSGTSRPVTPPGKRLLGFHLSADKQWLTRAKESIAGIVELKEKQCESNLTGLLITRLIFETLYVSLQIGRAHV